MSWKKIYLYKYTNWEYMCHKFWKISYSRKQKKGKFILILSKKLDSWTFWSIHLWLNNLLFNRVSGLTDSRFLRESLTIPLIQGFERTLQNAV